MRLRDTLLHPLSTYLLCSPTSLHDHVSQNLLASVPPCHLWLRSAFFPLDPVEHVQLQDTMTHLEGQAHVGSQDLPETPCPVLSQLHSVCVFCFMFSRKTPSLAVLNPSMGSLGVRCPCCSVSVATGSRPPALSQTVPRLTLLA